jgi:hypothetical protein
LDLEPWNYAPITRHPKGTSRDKSARNRRGLGFCFLKARLDFAFDEEREVSVGTGTLAVEIGLAELEVEELVEGLVDGTADKRAAVTDTKMSKVTVEGVRVNVVSVHSTQQSSEWLACSDTQAK